MRLALSTALLSLLGLLGCTEKTTTQAGAGTGAQTANVIVCAPGSYMNGNECLPVKAPECPSGTVARDGQCVPREPEKVAVQAPPDETTQIATALASDEDPVLDTRRSRLQPRSRALLVTELQGLESLFASMPKDAADRPMLIRRLAEGYVELEAAAQRDRGAASDPDTISKATKIEAASRAVAIKYYAMLVNQYPKFCRAPNANNPSASQGCGDEPLYYLSLEYTRGNDLDKARRTMLQLIQSWPQSPHVPYTYFMFGEMFRKEAAGDPSKWTLAEQSYLETVKYPGPTTAPAYERLAGVYDAEGKPAEAKSARKKAERARATKP